MRVTIEQIRDEVSDRIEVATSWAYGMTGGGNGRNRRLAGSIVFVLMVHAVFFWALVVTHPRDMDLPTFEDPVYPVELFEIPPPEPEPEPVVKRDVQPVETPPQPVVQPEVVQKTETPQPVAQPQPQNQPVPQVHPNVVESPRPSLSVKPVEVPDFTVPQRPSVRQQTQRDVVADSRNAPVVTPTPSPNLGIKKKETEEQLQARTQDTAVQSNPVRDVTALNLHEPPKVSQDALPANVAPSGLASSGGKPASGATAGLPPGSLQGVNGTLKGGRSGVSQAIQNHNSCVSIQIKGKPIPQGCDMNDLASMGNLGPKPDSDFQAAAARRDANLKYKSDTGSTEYWQRVNQSPQPGSAGRDDGLPQRGAYSSAKDQRVMNGSTTDPKSGN